MWKCKRSLNREYEEEYQKQTEPYSYYLTAGNAKENKNIIANEGEHESVPFICILKDDNENLSHRVYECDDYLVFEDKRGRSSEEERLELVTNAKKLNADLIYSDVDDITCDGKRRDPFFKPDFGIDTFRCFDYISDFYAVKKEKSRMDISLLVKISHVTKPLFHYNVDQNKEDNTAERYKGNTCYKTDDFYFNNLAGDDSREEISIIIPSKDNPSLIRTCLNGIKKAKIKSQINVLEVVLVDNGSSIEHKKEITRVIDELNVDGLKIKYIYEAADFNFSAMCNRGVKESKGKYLLFLNDDIEVTDELFLLKLLYFAKMEHVGAVGCKLLYPGEERRIQHVGITCLKYPGPSHKLSTFPDDRIYYFGRNIGVHNCLAVTGACLMVSREKYYKIGGFCDKMKVGYNDVDLCISLYEDGYSNVVNNECVLIHHESITRGSDAVSEEKLSRLDTERELLYERHPWILSEGDPFYNLNLAGDFLDYRVNVIPDFERRDYFSRENTILEKYISDSLIPSKHLFFNIEKRVINRQYCEISGWALINKKENYLFDTYVFLIEASGKKHVYSTARVKRSDLKEVFPDAKSVGLSGFFARVPKEYTIDARFGVLVVNKQSGKKYYAGFNESDI